jgi:hypothetical protein
MHRIAYIRDAFEQYRKLIAPKTRDGVFGVRTCSQTVSNGDEQLITRFVTKAVVDQFEAIKVQEQDCNDCCVPRVLAHAQAGR